MADNESISNAERIALELLEVFVPHRPLGQEEFEEWIEINSLSHEEVKEAARQAVRNQWIEDTPDGLVLTESGQAKTEQ